MGPLWVTERINAIFQESLSIEPPRPEVDLLEQGILDSLTFVSLLHRLEEVFGIKISLETLELDTFSSVARIGELVARLLG
jgi:acyl carrier protein